MKFNVDENTSIKSSNFEAGIHEGFNLTKIESFPKTDDFDMVEFTFEHESGFKVTERFYEFGLSDENTDWRVKSLLRRSKNIAICFIPEDKFVIETVDNTDSKIVFRDYWTKYVKLLGNYSTQELRIKLTYNKSGFLQLGRFLPFIEPTTVDVGNTEIFIDKSEVMERPAQTPNIGAAVDSALGNIEEVPASLFADSSNTTPDSPF